MNFDCDRGSLFLMDNDGQWISIGDCSSSTIEYLPEINEKAKQALFDVNKDFSFSCALNACDLELLSNSCYFDPSQSFTVEYDVPIMIQARWHKKKRVRKKWLKRYGMRQDTVHVKTDAAYLSEHDGCIEFETESLQYILRPHQNRRNLKVQI